MRFAQLALAGLFLCAVSAAQAQIQTFDLTYSGAAFSNTAVGMGTITIDESQFFNPGVNDTFVNPFVTALNLTISGASSGNGTFTLADFGEIILDTNGGTFDLTQELVGQPTAVDPYGTVPSGGNAGDFNLFIFDPNTGNIVNPTAPTGTFFFQLTTNGGAGDTLYLTSFRPAAVPEPGSVALLVGMGMTGAGFLARRRKAAKAA